MDIYLTYWSKGNNFFIYEESINIHLIEMFILNIQKYNPDITINIICDKLSYKTISSFKKYNNTKVYQNELNIDNTSALWCLSKLETMLTLPNGFIHFDYDIFLKFPIKKLYNYLIDNNINCFYQSVDFGFDHYNKFIEKLPHLLPYEPVALCGGITFWGDIDKDELINIVYTTKEKLIKKNYFWMGLSMEQLLVPSYFNSKGYNIKTLYDSKGDIFGDLNLNTKKLPTFFDNFYPYLVNNMGIQEDIGYYHFMGHVKNNKNFIKNLKIWLSDF